MVFRSSFRFGKTKPFRLLRYMHAMSAENCLHALQAYFVLHYRYAMCAESTIFAEDYEACTEGWLMVLS